MHLAKMRINPGVICFMESFTLSRALEGFFRLQLNPMSQAGILRLEKGKASSERPESDPEHDQSLLLIEGELVLEVDNAGETIRPGASFTVPAGVKHRIVNRSNKPAVAFTVMA